MRCAGAAIFRCATPREPIGYVLSRDARILMITEGKYSVWFKTPVGEGAGEVVFGPDGKLTGGDAMFSFSGN